MSPTFAPYLEHLRALAVSPVGPWLAVGGHRDADIVSTSAVHLFDPRRGDYVGAIEHDGGVGGLAFGPDRWLVVGSLTGGLAIADVVSRRTSGIGVAAHGAAITQVAARAAGDLMLSVAEDGSVAVHRLTVEGDLPQLSRCAAVTVSALPLRAAAWDPVGGRVLVGGDEGRLVVASLDELERGAWRPIALGEVAITALLATDDGRVVIGAQDGSIRIAYLDGPPDIEVRSRDRGHQGAVRGLTWSAREPRRLFSAGDDGTVQSWPFESRRAAKSVPVSRARIDGLVGLPTGLIAIDRRREIHLVPLEDDDALSASVTVIAGRLAELRHLLKAKSVTVREHALEHLATLPEDEARQALERALRKDSHPALRKRAAECLGATGRSRSRPALVKALADDDASVRRAAFDALLALDVDPPLAALQAALGSRHADLRIVALTALPPLHTRSPSARRWATERLTDGDAAVRAAALETLFAIDTDDPRDALETALERGPADLRVAALLRFSAGDAASLARGDARIERAIDDDDPDVRRVAYLLALWRKPRLWATLWAIDGSLAEGIQTLAWPSPPPGAPEGPLEDDDRAPMLASLLAKHPDAALRGARSLALLGDPRAAGALLQLSREPRPDIRRATVATLEAALHRRADVALRLRLEWMLEDAEASVRADALDALTRLAAPDDDVAKLDLATLLLDCGPADVRTRALPIVIAFDASHAPALHAQAQTLLANALDDEDEAVRRDAFRTLASWYREQPERLLGQVAASRHADLRLRAVHELERRTDAAADALLRTLIADSHPDVARAAYRTFTDSDVNPARVQAFAKSPEIHLVALDSPLALVRAAGCEGAKKSAAGPLRSRLVALLDDEDPAVHRAAIEALDHLCPNDAHALAVAFGSPFLELRVRAAELAGLRRDRRPLAPMLALLSIPPSDPRRPPTTLRRRAAEAIADIGASTAMNDYVALLRDDDPIVREMGARGLANAVRPGSERPLIDALAHDDLSVRSWAAEGLSRLGDARAMPVLAGTLRHEHPPIRLGAIVSLVALGSRGRRGILQGLSDPDPANQDLVFAIVVAQEASIPARPDLLVAALSAARPEIRFAAARVLETRLTGDDLEPLIDALVGPVKPAKASEEASWPEPSERLALVHGVAAMIRSDDPAQRYAAARVLTRRPQADAYWREAKRLRMPVAAGRPDAPATHGEHEVPRAVKPGWIRRLMGESRPGESAPEHVDRPPPPVSANDPTWELVFGTYVGLVRQAPAPGESDEHHRLRRDSLQRLRALASVPALGRSGVLPAVRRALADAHHSVRKAAWSVLRSLYADDDLTPFETALEAPAGDVAGPALDTLIEKASGGQAEARRLVLGSLDAPNPETRQAALDRVARLFDDGSIEPWLLALRSRHADVRRSVIDRLLDRQDPRVDAALRDALGSDHDDLRLKAAYALASRGDRLALDVLVPNLRASDPALVQRTLAALVGLAHARPDERNLAEAVAQQLVARAEDDPEGSADLPGIVDAVVRVGDRTAAPWLRSLLDHRDAKLRLRAFESLRMLAVMRAPERLADGRTRQRYEDAFLRPGLDHATGHADLPLRRAAIAVLRDIDEPFADTCLGRLLGDREPEIRVAAAEAMAFRAEYVPGADLQHLARALREGRRELVLPTAEGLAVQGHAEALPGLLLVLRAGDLAERRRALLALGRLRDARAAEDVEAALDEDDLAATALQALGALLRALPAETAERVRARIEQDARLAPPARRRGALLGLRDAGDDRSAAVLLAIAREPLERTDVRVEAVRAAAGLASAEVEPSLAALLSDRDAGLRRAASEALAPRLRTDPLRVHVLRLQSPFPEIAEPAATALAHHGDAATLLALLSAAPSDAVRRRLCEGLRRHDNLPRAGLIALLAHPSLAVAAEGAWLSASQHASDLATELAALGHRARLAWRSRALGEVRPPEVARAWEGALWALGRAVPPLLAEPRATLDDDAPPAAQRLALATLGTHGDASDERRLRRCLTAPDPEIRRAAATALARIAPQGATAALRELAVGDAPMLTTLSDAALREGATTVFEDPALRNLALPHALDERHRLALEAIATQSRDDAARRAALESLGRIASPASQSLLRALGQDPSLPEALRKTAFKAYRRAQRTIERPAP